MKFFISIFLMLACLTSAAKDCPKPNTSVQKAILDSGKINEEFCDPLKTGETRIINDPDTALTSARYRLTKTSSDEFLVEINPKFKIKSDVTKSPQEASRLRRDYRSGMANCLKEASKYMLGPNGERLEIKVSQDNKIPVSQISVSSATQRNHSKGYAPDIDCNDNS
jgi:hypothetical protein